MESKYRGFHFFVKGLTNFMLILPSHKKVELLDVSDDARNIYLDWEAVGKDIEKATLKYRREYKIKPNSTNTWAVGKH